MDLENRWKELCAMAATEKDPTRLSQLVSEIMRLIDLQQARRRGDGGETPSKEDKDGSTPEINQK